MTQKKTDIKILVGYHKPYSLLKSDILTPIHTGRIVALEPTKDAIQNSSSDLDWMIAHMDGDDTGDNISERNRNYNELSAIYWAWKNYDKLGNPSHFGFMQYRRHLIFNEPAYVEYAKRNNDERAYAKRNVGYVHPGYQEEFGLTDKQIEAYTQKYDVILPESCELGEVGIESVHEDYVERIEGTKPKDLKVLLTVVKDLYPAYYEPLKKYLTINKKRCYQMFVLRKDVFFEYCDFLFTILDAVDKRIDTSTYSVNGQRTIGYLGEILYGVYFAQLIANNDKNLKIKELGTTYLSANSLSTSIKEKTAIVLLAYSDFESLEITLAAYGKTLQGTNTKLFVLQNGRGSYDTERTYRVAQRYADLYPRNIEVVDDIAPQKPYTAIRQLLNSKRMKAYDYICKVDDDAFPLTDNWLDELCNLYEEKFAEIGNNLAYVSGIVNNNPFGFKQLVERNSKLGKEYFEKIAIDHKIGFRGKKSGYAKEQIIPASEIGDGVAGTVWGYPFIARWLHEKTTLRPQEYIDMVKEYPDQEVGDKRYSINNMLFAKGFWNDIHDDNNTEYPADDEYLSEQYCKREGKSIFVKMSVPFVHIFFFVQRDENKDMIPAIREVYQDFLGVNYPIAVQASKEFENENRLRFIETKINSVVHPYRQRTIKKIESVVRRFGDKAAPKGSMRRKPLTAMSQAVRKVVK